MKKILIIFVLIAVSVSITTVYAQNQYQIPSWVKEVAGFWAEGKINDADFGEGLAFLIDNGMIKVPLIQELENRISQLENENRVLQGLKKNPEPTPSSSITVSTDRFHYEEGDIIVISGKVPVILGNTPVTLQLFSGRYLIAIEQTTVAQDGSFTKAFFPDILWEQGDITVEASYQEYKAETKFSYTTKPTYSNYQNCDPSYPDVCIPPYPPDLDCGEIGYSNFRVIQPDPHRFDRDNDGIGCES